MSTFFGKVGNMFNHVFGAGDGTTTTTTTTNISTSGEQIFTISSSNLISHSHQMPAPGGLWNETATFPNLRYRRFHGPIGAVLEFVNDIVERRQAMVLFTQNDEEIELELEVRRGERSMPLNLAMLIEQFREERYDDMASYIEITVAMLPELPTSQFAQPTNYQPGLQQQAFSNALMNQQAQQTYSHGFTDLRGIFGTGV